MGVAAGDYDADGDVDLYVTNLGRNTLLRNDGPSGFTDVTHSAAVGDEVSYEAPGGTFTMRIESVIPFEG